MTAVAQRVAFGETLVELAERFPDLLVLDGDLANSTRSDILSAAHPDRFLEMGIAEQNMVGVAAGLATLGFIPWVTSFAAFITSRDLDQIRVVVAQPRLNVKLAGAYSGIMTAATGKTHQCVEDIAVFRAMPNMTVVAPADGNEVRAAMHALTEHVGPVYLRLTRDPGPLVTTSGRPFEIGRAFLLRDGSDVALISTGAQTARTLEAAELLAARGISALVLHVPTLKPLDGDAIVAAAARTGRVVTAEEHSVIGGLGGAVAETLAERRPTRMARVGLRDVFGESGPNGALLAKYGLTARHVADAACKVIADTAA
ncbi:MAG TPA: transketolase C-terminal domain-containing protein [Chloroflexota bacterium]|nr:transketolase C-terminal domain-containing protein [Chloroflexota bacterium]